MAASKTVIDLARDMRDNERLSTAKLEEIQNDLPAEEMRAWSDAVGELADALDEVDSYFSEWQDATGEERTEARESLLEALGTVVDAADNIDNLTSYPEVSLGG